MNKSHIRHTRRYLAIRNATYHFFLAKARPEPQAYDALRLIKPTCRVPSISLVLQPHNATASPSCLPNWFSIIFISGTPFFFYLTSMHKIGVISFQVGTFLGEFVFSWSSVCMPLDSLITNFLLARNLTQRTQPVDNPSVRWCPLASTSYVDTNPCPGFISTLVIIRQVETSDRNIIDVPIDRIEECLSLMSVFAFSDRIPHFSDASRFCQEIHISMHLTVIQMGCKTLLTSASGWQERLLL